MEFLEFDRHVQRLEGTFMKISNNLSLNFQVFEDQYDDVTKTEKLGFILFILLFKYHKAKQGIADKKNNLVAITAITLTIGTPA